MTITLLTTCSNRKRFQSLPDLQVRNLRFGDQSAVAVDWTAQATLALRKSKKFPVSDLYCGRGFKEALRSVESAAHLWVASAGFGLLRGTDSIPAYDATVSSVGSNAIPKRLTGDSRFDGVAWWQSLADIPVGVPSIECVLRESNDLVVVGLTAAYADLLASDLVNISDDQIHRLRIVRSSNDVLLPSTLLTTVLPYDKRFDGPDGPYPGTRSDFVQRACRHFITHIHPTCPDGSAATHARRVRRIMDTYQPPRSIKRQSVNNEEARQLIRKHWDQVDGASGRMLRLFRDDLEVACEQTRFKNLFKEVKLERSC